VVPSTMSLSMSGLPVIVELSAVLLAEAASYVEAASRSNRSR
jgi:hypothetical protein